MPNATVDDQDIRCEFGGNWNFFRGESGPRNASGWQGQTYASCGGPGYWEQGKDCELRVPFVGCVPFLSPHRGQRQLFASFASPLMNVGDRERTLTMDALQNLRRPVRRFERQPRPLLVPTRARRPTSRCLGLVRRRFSLVVAVPARYKAVRGVGLAKRELRPRPSRRG